MRQRYVDRSFRAESLAQIATANAIIAKYQAGGMALTLRQLYYQFVALHGLPNNLQSYKKLARLISDARLAGLVDWDAIEDRTRRPDVPSSWGSISEIVTAAIRGYRRDRWAGQTHYVELWVEKEALASVLQPLARRYHVALSINRGYSSQSAMHDAAERFIEHSDALYQELLYVGDHDPSGEDMVRDIGERLEMFGVSDLTVHKVALTRTQVETYRPPPNPAKKTDARYRAYAREHGAQSWEVDALDPAVLQRMVTDALDELLDRAKMDAIVATEERERAQLTAALKKIKPGVP